MAEVGGARLRLRDFLNALKDAGLIADSAFLLREALTFFNALCYRMGMEAPVMDRPLPVRHKNEPCCGVVTAPSLSLARTEALAERLKALGDPTRLRMLDLLAQQTAPLCVCDITPQFPQNQPTISHHLRLLREAALIDCEKRGIWAFYWATEMGKECLSAIAPLT